jgi:hypothetical protein
MNRRDHKSKPAPRTSPATDHRRVVVPHGNETSVGTKPNDNRHRTITDPRNGRDTNGRGGAPGSNGAPVTDEGNFLPSSW